MTTDIETLTDRAELHRSIIRKSPAAIFLVDASSRRILEANPATTDLLGYEADELLRMSLDDVDLSNREDHGRLLDRVLQNHHEILGERTLRRRGGRTIPVEASANLLLYEGREVVCYFARDISERHEAAAESQRLQRALALSQKHEAVGRLAAGIAHDFNNQLMVMLLCAESVSQSLGPADPNQEELGDLLEAGKSAAGLIRQLLAFSGQQILRPTILGVDEAIEQQRKMLVRTLGADVKVVTSYHAAAATVYFDRTQLEQVILNLAVNARDAMPRGGTFMIETKLVDVGGDFTQDFATVSSGPHVQINVSDSGMGMDDKTLSKVFEPFFTTKESGKGTGLGLATVYGIVKQSGGSIWASSAPGAGTTFRIYLPLTTEEPKETVIQDPRANEVPGGDETLLVVDDDEMVRVLASRILRDLGYTVLEASGPNEALDMYFNEDRWEAEVDLVLTDVVMPDDSGPDLIRELVERGGGQKVIFMSGYSNERIRQDDLVSPDYLFIEKPLGRTELARAVRTTLDR